MTADSTTNAEGHARIRLQRLILPLLVFALFIAFWYLLAEVILPEHRRFLVPPPHRVISVAFVADVSRSELLIGLWETTKVTVAGLAAAIIIGVGLAVFMSQARWIEQSLFPYAILLQVIPILAIVPLVGLMFGFGFLARVMVVTIFALWPIINNSLFGLKSADPDMHNLFSLKQSSRWTRFIKLQLPAALPAIFQGFRIGAAAAVIGAIVGEFFFRRGAPGLGILLDRYRAQLRTPELYGAIVLSGILGLAVFVIFGLLTRTMTGKWYVTHEKSR